MFSTARARGLAFAVGTAAIVCWIYAPAIRGSWIWDDVSEVAQNRQVTDPSGPGPLWSAPDTPDYFPLKSTAQWVQWRIWGDRTAGYHCTNIAFHLIGALLLWKVMRRLGVRAAWLGGLVFAIHPVAVESVAWIAEFKNVLSFPLLLLALCAYIDFDEGGGWRPYSRSLLFFGASLLCKSSGVMLPVALPLYAWWRRNRIARSDIRASAPFFAVALVFGLVTLRFQQHRAMGEVGVALGGFLPRLANAGRVIVFYLGKCLWPVRLSPIYGRWTLSPPPLSLLLSWFVLGAITALFWSRRQTWGRSALFGFGWFVLHLIPVAGLIPMAYLRISWVADHLAYVSLAGLAGCAAAAIGAAWASLGLMGRRVLAAGVAVLCAALAAESREYAGNFRDERTFWTYTLQRNPEAWLAHANLGLLLSRDGDGPGAVREFDEALRLNPGYGDAHSNLGVVLAGMGRLPEAVAHFRSALAVKPDSPFVQANLGSALNRLGRFQEAIVQYREALKLSPDVAWMHYDYGNVLLHSGENAAAADAFNDALRLDPRNAAAHNNLGLALARLGRLTEAIGHYEEAVRLDPAFAAAHLNLGVALRKAGRPADAEAQFQEAARIQAERTPGSGK